MEMPQTTPHPELVKKWTRIFQFFDIDGDGHLTRGEFDDLQHKLMKNKELSEKDHCEMDVWANDMWHVCLGKRDDEFLTLKEFIARFHQLNDKGMLEDHYRIYRSRVFCCLDVNDDQSISFDEFMIFADAVRSAKDPGFTKSFNFMADGNGLVSKQDYVEAYVRYVVDPELTLKDFPGYGSRPLYFMTL